MHHFFRYAKNMPRVYGGKWEGRDSSPLRNVRYGDDPCPESDRDPLSDIAGTVALPYSVLSVSAGLARAAPRLWSATVSRAKVNAPAAATAEIEMLRSIR